ncbi:NAD(P)-dependent dehydrogenase (short-subunit alcohol dehydrogenase family) [Paenarthrobacter nicotinovorans]|uniref:SDR family NAD(P)-dependent oxidoreductase n=1 Tax=Micrococcaceae TaxID=1268 RepID=UPI000876143A|nr:MULTISPECIES: SDR family NAD(P)-dependent oxidoreductase [Micrococcaceae]MDR6436725.1 NAD(P)-dependent dehydrogenase (short-subunit alcohol dehydrogenase family) [Paenarthrobacter nicotinovorans]SCZ56792.1 3-oxoacyl-[acyl-carrier protein] reductase [Arthrobacter sp. UNCCL28]
MTELTHENLTRTATPETYWPGRFQGQVILVTGAAGGLGSDTADRLAREGATVVCTDVFSGGRGNGSSPSNSLALDVTSRQDWDQTVHAVLDRHGKIDGALFAHGIQGPEVPVTEMPAEGWSKTLSVNLDGCLHGLAALLPILTKNSYGRIAILSSISAREGNPHQAAYSASKAGLVALVKTAAKEVAPYGVTVNSIAPSMMKTRLLQDLSPERNAQLLAKVPMGRIGLPEEFSALATWLLSTEASYMTGQTLDLSGGRNTA